MMVRSADELLRFPGKEGALHDRPRRRRPAVGQHDPLTHNGVQTGFGKPGYNPNKMICVSRDVTGSRLQAVRECHTAQQWEDQKMQEAVGLARQAA